MINNFIENRLIDLNLNFNRDDFDVIKAMIENFNIEASSSSHNKHQHVNQSFSHDSNIQKTMLKAKNKTLTQRVDYLKLETCLDAKEIAIHMTSYFTQSIS